ncbi:hypothetical protein F8S20_04060 [Nostoc sp. BAE]|nr:hypothetical protein [Nostoc commune BAE]
MDRLKSWDRTFIIWFLSQLSCFIVFWLYSHFFPLSLPDEANRSLEKILQQTGWANTKLQRVEKSLGTDPNQRRRR